MLTRMAGEKPRRPQFVRIAEFLGFAAGEIHDPCLGCGCDRRFLAGPRTIVERRHRTIGQGPFDATLDSLMVHPDSLRHRKKTTGFPSRRAVFAPARPGSPAPPVTEPPRSTWSHLPR